MKSAFIVTAGFVLDANAFRGESPRFLCENELTEAQSIYARKNDAQDVGKFMKDHPFNINNVESTPPYMGCYATLPAPEDWHEARFLYHHVFEEGVPLSKIFANLKDSWYDEPHGVGSDIIRTFTKAIDYKGSTEVWENTEFDILNPNQGPAESSPSQHEDVKKSFVSTVLGSGDEAFVCYCSYFLDW